MRLHSRQYEEVLASDRWRVVRAEAIRRAGLSLHGVWPRWPAGRAPRARGYENLGYERPEELQALCRTCHDAVHAQRQLVNAGCLKVLLWVVVIAIALQAMSWLMVSVMRGLDIS
jgi:hypothetical protein